MPISPADAGLLESALDSARFALFCLEPCPHAADPAARPHPRARSSFVDPDGQPMLWHDFGPLEGPGWAANAAGGALDLLLLAGHTGQTLFRDAALGLLDHVLEEFLAPGGFIRGYRDLRTGSLCDNYLGRTDWVCPGSLARVAHQLLLAGEAAGGRYAEPTRGAALAFAREWLPRVQRLPSGWLPRRCVPDGSPYPWNAWGKDPDPIHADSGDGVQAVHLLADLVERGALDLTPALTALTAAFTAAGGHFGSCNHDTYDHQECVCYALACRALLAAARALRDPSLAAFALGPCLDGLTRFHMHEDRNGVATAGLLYMEDSWDTAYLWENAEVAMAYLEAAAETGRADLVQRARAILEGIARHHVGPHGFLTEGVDWNNHVGQQHHVDLTRFGAIRYTEPLLNNLHVAAPTVAYLERAGKR